MRKRYESQSKYWNGQDRSINNRGDISEYGLHRCRESNKEVPRNECSGCVLVAQRAEAAPTSINRRHDPDKHGYMWIIHKGGEYGETVEIVAK